MAYRGSKLYIEMASTNKKKAKRNKYAAGVYNTQERNKKLYHRFYYHVVLKRCNQVDVIEALTKEFSISEITVLEIISKGAASIKNIRSDAPTKTELEKMFPFFNWK